MLNNLVLVPPVTRHFDWRRLRDATQERGDNKRWRAELTAMVMEYPDLREEGRRVCETNLLALCYVLGFCLITQEVHREALAFFPHLDGTKTVETLRNDVKRRRSLLLPRNTYKSTLDVCYCVQLILHFYMTIGILILSGSKELAFAFVDEVASFFVKMPAGSPTLFQVLFPELCVAKASTSGEFTAAIRQTSPAIIEPLIWGNSVESSTTGWHPDVLILDDVNNNRNSRSFQSRVKVTKAYMLTRKILKPTGIEMKIGTPYGTGDLFNSEILTSKPGTYDRVFKPAMRLKSGERLDPNGFPPEDEVELLFPSILSYDFLLEEYSADYDSFQSQYMLDSYGAAEIVFDEREVLGAMVEEEDLPMDGERKIVFRLPCRSIKWSKVSGAVGILHQHRMYITEIVQGHYKPSVLAKLIHDTCRKNGLHDVHIIESPGARQMQPVIDNYCITTGWQLYIHWIEFEEDSGVRDTHTRSIEALLATGRLLFSTGVKTKPLISGFVEYGMIDETGIPEVVAHVADALPVSIASEVGDDDEAWRMARERDKFNFVYGRGIYAPPEPEPEEIYAGEPGIEDQRYMENGLEILIPGLER